MYERFKALVEEHVRRPARSGCSPTARPARWPATRTCDRHGATQGGRPRDCRRHSAAAALRIGDPARPGRRAGCLCDRPHRRADRPAASTYAPAVEALRIYIERVNAAGGINGKKVKLILQDDSAEPGKAAANAKKLITQDNVVLLINSSLSSTYAPMVAEAKRAGVPLLFAGSVCPKDVYPPADPLQFCTTAFASNYDSRAALAFVKETAKEPVKIGFSAMAIPISRGEMDFAESRPALGMTLVDKEVIPPPTPDYTPFATKLKDAGANWVFSWAPWVTQVRTLEALRRLDWEGDYIAWSHIEAEGELARLKDRKFYVIGANALFQDALPIHKEIADAAKRRTSVIRRSR